MPRPCPGIPGSGRRPSGRSRTGRAGSPLRAEAARPRNRPGPSPGCRPARVQRGAEVVLLEDQALDPGELRVAAELGVGRFGEGEEVVAVAVARRLGPAGFDQLVAGVLADRLQEVVALLASLPLGDDE